jgi:NADPH2:quinone reductase
MAEIARHEHVSCKFSGLVTEADWDSWRPEDVLPYASRVVEWFGEDRLLFGSDWPVCTVAASYDEVVALAEQIVGAGNERVFGGNAERVYRLPEAGSFELGASLGVPAMTAHRALTVAEDGPARLGPGALAGKVVLVAGGAGAVGHAAIQLARWAGATVITTVSSAPKAALAGAAGAHHVVNYRESEASVEIRHLAPDGVDLVVEVAPAQNAELNLAVIRNRGSIAVYANNGGDALTLDVRRHFGLNLRYQFLLLYTVGQDARDAAAADINAAIADGALPVGDHAGLPLHRFDLAHTADAHTAVENDAVGKVLIEVGTA